jgi:glycosyltransferase involved in cell wall biosynthesis
VTNLSKLPNKQPLLSIIIPTCNRKTYLKSVVRTLLEVCNESEIIISDNSDDDSIRSLLVSDIEESKITYVYHTERISVVENFERALKLASGRYIMFIGDDDCVGPQLEKIAAWADTNSVDAVLSYRDEFLANYFWPGVQSKYLVTKYAEHLFVNQFSGEVWKFDSRKALKDACSKPGVGMGSLPRIYQGLVRKSLIDQIVSKYGSLFGGVSPDIYSGALISYEAGLTCIVDFPFVIPGGSAQSTAGMGAARTDVSSLYAFDHIIRFGPKLAWDCQVPEFYSSTTVWAYSLQKALSKINDDSFKLNFARLYGRCILLFFGYRNHTFKAVKMSLKMNGHIIFMCQMAQGLALEILLQVNRAYRKISRKQQIYTPLVDIGSAYEALQKHIAENSIKLSLIELNKV